MRLSPSLILAGALVVAAPALAQDNAIAPANTVTTTTADANMDANMAAPATTTPANGAQDATLPPTVAAPADAAPVDPPRRGFPWGVLGLVGLIGLLGVRKVKSDG